MLESLVFSRLSRAEVPRSVLATCDHDLGNFPQGSKTLEGGKSYCFHSMGFFMIGATNIKISTIVDGTESAQVEKGLGATPKLVSNAPAKTQYRIVPEKKHDVTFIDFRNCSNKIVTTVDGKEFTHDKRLYLSLKAETEDRVTTKITKESSKITQESTYLAFYNPNEVKIEVGKSEDSTAILEGEGILNDKNKIKRDGFIFTKPSKFEGKTDIELFSQEDGTYEASSEIKLLPKAEKIPVADKFFEIKPDTIYSMDTENAEMVYFVSDGISGGIIALIVILIIVVVVVIAFCIYWFVFRKKS